ncbi:hypothetical protein HaLaN_30104, partial [Haematococcus lacustris]
MSGNGCGVYFSNCFQGNEDWDTRLSLFEAETGAELAGCGGQKTAVKTESQNCWLQDSKLAYLVYQLDQGKTYML